MSSRDLVRLLEARGWKLQRIRGSHHTYAHPEYTDMITAPHPRKDLGKGLVRKILKQVAVI